MKQKTAMKWIGILLAIAFSIVLFVLGVQFVNHRQIVSSEETMRSIMSQFDSQVSQSMRAEIHTKGQTTVVALYPTDENEQDILVLTGLMKQIVDTKKYDEQSKNIIVFQYKLDTTLKDTKLYQLYQETYTPGLLNYHLDKSELYGTKIQDKQNRWISLGELTKVPAFDKEPFAELLKESYETVQLADDSKKDLMGRLTDRQMNTIDYVYSDQQFGLLTSVNGEYKPIVVEVTPMIAYFKENLVFSTYQKNYQEKVAAIDEKRESNKQEKLETVVEMIKATVPSKKVALTFDDGPNPLTTPRALDILKKHQVLGTFYMLGNRVEVSPELAKRIKDEGHDIGNHSFSHPNLTTLSKEEAEKQIVDTSRIIEQATGSQPTSFRPPYGEYNKEVSDTAGLPVVMWDVDSLDWSSRNAATIVSQVLGTVRDGSIILVHDIHKETIDSLDTLITSLKERGYQLVTISQLYEEGLLQKGVVYYGQTDARIIE